MGLVFGNGAALYRGVADFMASKAVSAYADHVPDSSKVNCHLESYMLGVYIFNVPSSARALKGAFRRRTVNRAVDPLFQESDHLDKYVQYWA